MNTSSFPIEKVTQVLSNPDDFRLLSRAPSTLEQLQAVINTEQVGDELEVVILDLETTGLEVEDADVIEVGLLSALYSPSLQRFTQVVRAGNFYEQPRSPIHEDITAITGITNEMVEGKVFDHQVILEWFKHDPIVVAHNASFDRKFFEARFNDSALKNLRWACSINDVDWYSFNFGSQKLEYLLMTFGYFYEAHRALVDCMATLFLLHLHADARNKLITSAFRTSYQLHALGAPFEAKDALKANGYKWKPDSPLGKHWVKEVSDDEYDEEWSFLQDTYYDCGGRPGRAKISEVTARTKFK